MIAHELIFLGLLKESPKHGYEIRKKINEILSVFAGVDLKSIYYPLRSLEKKGMVIKRINKPGRRPQRLVYELTPKGEDRFNAILTRSLLDFKRPQFSLDLSLYFLRYIESSVAKRRLRARMQVLENLAKSLKQMEASVKTNKKASPLGNILEHNLQMVETEFKFLENLVKTL